jgi:hypothetical protein
MQTSPPAQKALYRLLAAAWDPQCLQPKEIIPWNDVLQLVELNNLGGMVYTITKVIRPNLPVVVQQALEQEFYRTLTANTRILHQLTWLQQELSDLGTPILLLKGAALAQELYPDTASRLIGDIDLVVPLEKVLDYRKKLLKLEYLPGLIEHQPGKFLAQNNQEMFEPPAPFQGVVELHWHILDVPYYMHHIPMVWFWQHSNSLNIAGKSYQVLDVEANLVYLPAHLGLHHRFQRLHSFFDIALLILQNQETIDWQRVIATAHSFELLSALHTTLVLLAEYWPELPLLHPLQLLQDCEPSQTDARLFRLLTSELRSPNLDFYTTLRSLPNIKAKISYAWVNAFPQPVYMMGRYSIRARWQLPFWYFYRLAGGLWRFLINLPQARRIER